MGRNRTRRLLSTAWLLPSFTRGSSSEAIQPDSQDVASGVYVTVMSRSAIIANSRHTYTEFAMHKDAIRERVSRDRLITNLLRRMGEIDSNITKSLYRPLTEGEQDECPTGDDYNLLWDLDEITVAYRDMQADFGDVTKLLGQRWPHP